MAVNSITTLRDSTLLDSRMAINVFTKDVLNHIIADRASCPKSQNPRVDMSRLKPMTLGYMGRALDHYTIYDNT